MGDFESKTVNVGAKKYTVTEFSGKQRKTLFELYKKDQDPITVQAHIVKMGCAELAGSSIDELLDMPGRILLALSDEILILSGLTERAQATAEKKS